MQPDEEKQFWIRRLEATGKAQARYLWFLLIAQIFYLALHSRGTGHQEISVPIVDLKLDGVAVLASGAPIIAFLVLAVVGAIRAWTHAVEQVAGKSPVRDAEHLDAHPNAIDLAMYTTKESPAIVRGLLYFVYPSFLTVALVEAAWLGAWLWSDRVVPSRALLLPALVVTGLPATFLVLAMWVKRVKQLWKGSRAV